MMADIDLREINRKLQDLPSRKGPGSMSAAEDTEQRQRELAVLEAAREVVNDQPDARDRPSSWAKLALLEEEVKALDALNEPQPVDPQTLKVGQKFRLESADGLIYRCVWSPDGTGSYINTGDWMLRTFKPDDRVIPIEES